MKYTVETIINKPKLEVVKLYDNVDNNYKWMEGLESLKLIEGEAGKQGAKSQMKFKTSKEN